MTIDQETDLLLILKRIACSLENTEERARNSLKLYEEEALKNSKDAKEITKLQKIIIEKQIIDTYGEETLKLWKQGKISWE
jgi:hypothetical protein